MLENKEFYKIEKGMYSNREYFDRLELLSKKYPNAIFTAESAFYYWGLTDVVPTKQYLATTNKAKPIIDSSIDQSFITDRFFEVGKTQTDYNNVLINIYDRERMLIELIRNKNSISFDQYKEIIHNYRLIIDELNVSKLMKYLRYFKNGENILNTIHREVF